MLKSEKIGFLPPNVFVQAEEQKLKAKKQGKKIYDFGVADPHYPSPLEAVNVLKEASNIPKNHHYAPFEGNPTFRKELANYYKQRFNVHLDPNKEIIALIGSKEGLFDICTTYLRQRDVALVPDPGFPTYHQAIFMAGGDIYRMPLLKENHYLPDLHRIPDHVLKRTKLLFLNYPHNPTGTIAPDSFIEDVIQFAKKHQIIVCSDNPFYELTFDGNKGKSFLEYKGAKDVGIEFMTFSKMFNMSGWRLAAAVGNKDVIDSLLKMFIQAHSSIFQPIQLAGAAVLKEVWPTDYLNRIRSDYQKKLDYAMEKLTQIGWKVERPQGAIYLWVPIPDGFTSDEFAEVLFNKYSVLVCPGIGFGELGEGYIRLAMTCSFEDHFAGIDLLCQALLEATNK